MFKRLRERNRDLSNRGVVLILIGIAGLSAIFSALMRGGLDNNWWADVSQGLVTEMAGAIATFWLINLIFEGRRQREQKSEAIAERKAELIRQMGSSINEETIRATEELRSLGWLRDGSLQTVDLSYANLQMAGLAKADLQEAILWSANLQWADLWDADLRGTSMGNVNLEGARLRGANLRGAKLGDTNLKEADLQDAEFDKTTVLPDGNTWTPETDMARFTDPNHPQFWRSDVPYTYAYRVRYSNPRTLD